MLVSDEQLSKILAEAELVSKDNLKKAKDVATRSEIPLYKALLNLELISDENLGRIIADAVGVDFISLSRVSIPMDILQIVPEVVAIKQRIVVFNKDKDGLHLAMEDPKNVQIREFVEKKIGIPVTPYFATEKDISRALELYTKDVTAAFDEIIAENVKQAKAAKAGKAELPIIKIVDTIISYAYKNKASDIHIEPEEIYSLVRFRIDGILHDIVKLPPEVHPKIVTRIKVLSKLRTDEHQAPQDGKIQYKVGDDSLDIRVSTVPVTEGEKIVMRLLSERSRQASLGDLGFSGTDLAKIEKAYKKPYGMILATGPTGSGKTTTMYAVLKILNEREVNIMTIEDPVEYGLQGVNQIQVNPKTNLTFATGLRSIVRQDPNIILVGEIRDEETAGIAVNSAMTGHLVLSTLHTNDAATAIPRLLDMGIEPFLVASSTNVIVAQRLVRKVHSVCKVSEEKDISELTAHLGEPLVKKVFGNVKTVRLYRGKGCKLDHGTGYEGRVGIYEVLEIDDEVRQAIVERKSAADIAKIAIKNSMTTMIENGLEKAKQGITTIDEILRVTKE